MKSAHGPPERGKGETTETSQESEFSRMERLMRGLLKVPKKAINGQGEKAKKKAG